MDKPEMKYQRNKLAILLFIIGQIFLVVGLLLKGETKLIMISLAAALCLGAVVLRLFKPGFGYKPSREEIEAKEFGREKV
jgi:hypothetical protein